MRKFKSKSSHPPRQMRLGNERFHHVGLKQWYTYWRDPYHLMLTVPWWGFLVIVALTYVAVNLTFALAYLTGGNCIENATPGSLLDAFFFSVQTLASIGYGAMYPTTVYANILVTLEALVELIGLAIVTGLAFARFSQPTARVMFTKFAVIQPYHGVPTLMFRTANQRANQILEAKLRVYLLRDEVSAEGHFMRRFYDLKLLHERTPSFTLTWMAMHPINPDSPLSGTSPESLIQTNAQIIVSFSGLDRTVSQAIHARHSYMADEILWNWRFVDLFYQTPEGDRYIDMTHFHEVVPIESKTRAVGDRS